MKLRILQLLGKITAKLLALSQKPTFTPKTSYAIGNSDSIQFENGLIIKYGGVAGAGGTAGSTTAAGCNQRITFPTPFPNNCFFVITGIGGIAPATSGYTVVTNSGGWDKDGFYASAYGINYAQGSNNTYWTTGHITYLAIGN